MTSKSTTPPAKRSKARAVLPWWKKSLFALLTTLAFFLLLEGVLWLAGVEILATQRDPYVGFAGNLPLFVPETDSDGRVSMTTAPNKREWFNVQRFPRQKAPGTRRVFCLGGSTTYGRPYDDTTSFSAWLRELLPSAAETRWEVINAGGISYASYRVAALMEELAQYQPDLFVVYTGHNEFLEERTYGDLKQKPAALLETAAVFGRSRTYSLLQSLIHDEPKREQERVILPGEVDAVLDHTVGPTSYHRDDRLREEILAHFRLNLARMAKLARECGAELVLVVPAVNLKDCSPFKSQHAAGLSDDQLEIWNEHYQRAIELESSKQFDEALAEYEKAQAIDARYAELPFRIARLLMATGRTGEASAAFGRALDEDICPLRAPSDFQQAIHEVAQRHDVPLVDFDGILKNDCLLRYGHNVPGQEYFLDHVHVTIDGHRLVAVSLVETLAEENLLGVGPLSETAIVRAKQEIQSRIDPKAHAIAERNLAKVLNWAGKHDEAGRLAVKSLKTLPDDPESLVIAAAYLRSKGQLDVAIEYLYRAIEQMPKYANARQLLGAMLVEARRLEEAQEQFLTLTEFEPRDVLAWQMLGAILAEQEKYEEALRYYRKALTLAEDDANLHYNLGFALARLNRPNEAKRHLTRALELNPDDKAARTLLTELGTP